MSLAHECIDLARRFRLGHHVESALALPALLERVLAALPTTRYSEAAKVIAALLACQERHDWLGLADWLEGELVTLLAP
ncbi:hypothetical protein ACV1D8_12505 [Aeromonas caviae]|uniref:Uncharacterized protein n=1 Tax=Aeromonas caviae TaxID=648 RepID=A0A3S7P4Q3_AERCA|nr:hypothetical protein [Aeromonas caviae]AXB03713.1 hypothetical protein C1C91_00420 [Aeromonas caviae]AXB08056.1 hypothetical protein C0708_03810 [Aeromonas caviae]